MGLEMGTSCVSDTWKSPPPIFFENSRIGMSHVEPQCYHNVIAFYNAALTVYLQVFADFFKIHAK